VLKLYPCILYEEFSEKSELAEKLKNGEWNPLTYDEYLKMLKDCLPHIPRYVHINRFQRFTEGHKIVAGPSEKIDRALFNGICKCLWHRSPAQTGIDLNSDFREYSLTCIPQGTKGYCIEAHLNNEKLLGYGRLTLIQNQTAIIRDLRVLGNMIPVGIKNENFNRTQHIGIGKSMLKKMEEKALDHGKHHIRIHTSPGARMYFEKNGYKQEGNNTSLGWMIKKLK